MREVNHEVYEYISKTFHPDDDLEFVREEMRKVGKEGMAISSVEAGILQFLIQTHRVKKIVEVGCFLGYSAIQMAKALPEDGKVYTLEYDEKFYKIAKENIKKAGYEKRIEIILGEAHDSLEKIQDQGPFDMVFIDADKGAYLDYLNWSEKYVKKGGLIIGDNTLLFGQVLSDEKPKGESEKRWNVMREFNQRLANSQKYTSTMLPTQEGMTLAVKKT